MTDHGDLPCKSAGQRRHAVRHKMFEPVAVTCGGGLPVRAHFLDLSCSGALVHSETPPVANRYVSIEVMGLRMSGKVMWVRGKRFGIQFSEALPPSEVDALVERR